MTKRKYFLYIGLIFILAIVLRGVMLWSTHPVTLSWDEPEYVGLSDKLYETGSYVAGDFIQTQFQGGKTGEPTSFRTPVLPFFIASHYKIFGKNLIYPRITLIIISSLIVFLLGYLAKISCFGERTGLITSFVWAIYPTSVFSPYSSDRLLTEGLGVFLLVSAFVFIVLTLNKPSFTTLILSGLILSLAVFTRGYMIFAIPLLAIFFYICTEKDKFRTTLLFLMIASSIPSIWVIRNWVVMGKAMLSTQTDQLYAGNNLWARGSQNGDVFSLGVEAEQFKVLVEKYPHFLQMSEVERSNIFTKEAINSIVNYPKHFLWLLWRKSMIYFLPLQIWSYNGWYQYNYVYFFFLIFSLVTIYRALVKGENRKFGILFLIPILAVYLAVLVTFATDRYRFVVEPFYILLGAYGIIEIGKLVLKRKSLEFNNS